MKQTCNLNLHETFSQHKVIDGERPAQANEQPQHIDINDSFEDDLGSNFEGMGDLSNIAAPENAHGTAVAQVSRALDKYAQHSKGYVPLQLFFTSYICSLRQRIQLQIKRQTKH